MKLDLQIKDSSLVYSGKFSEVVAFIEMGNTRGRNGFVVKDLFGSCYIFNAMIHLRLIWQ